MKRPLAVLATAVLTCVVGLAPAMSATATMVENLPNKATWVNNTLHIVWSTPSGGINQWPASDVFLNVTVDGTSVDSQEDIDVANRIVEVPRAADSGPAQVEVILNACIDGTEGYDCTPHTLYSATVTRTTVTRKSGQISAATLLGKLKVAKGNHASSYARSKFKLWIDANHDGENTRAEVLKAESKKRVTENRSHTVKTGKWVSAYDGKTFTVGSKLDIDHLVPLQEAWTSGAATWSTKKRTAYANDLGYGASLIAVSTHENRSNGDKEPNGYLPAKVSYRCAYVRNYIAVKYRWALTVDSTEKAALNADLAVYCINPFVTKPGKPNLTALVGKPKQQPHTGGSGTGSSNVYYKNCDAVRAAGKAPLYAGQPGYATPRLDRDGDGVACE